ncbi:MAG: hypothetical protein M1829_006582 [Trizodia sp. TS-e1964]|nr:MAG: hypothetical protein M1829_006582 [Trizodia sp. TS-e1964]
MAASAFMEHLSTDIKSLIVSFVTRPKDLQALCLVCKQLREIATRHLYRIVELDVGGEADLRLTAFLRSTNPGLAHIREISLTSSSLNDDGDESDDDRSSVMTVDNTEESLLSAQAHFATRLILDLIPNNILERFR